MDSYTLLQEIGVNSTTEVYQAFRNSDGLPVVLKVFNLDSMKPHHLLPYICPYSSKTKSVPSEVVLLEKVKNVSSCVRMLDSIDDLENGRWVIVLEDLCAQGYSNLARDIEESECPMEDHVVSWIMRELILVLEQLHFIGILHCDIKPDNIFVDYKRERIKLIDFNLGFDCAHSYTDYVPGCTPEYAPPEVLVQRKPWSAAGEVWSIGCTAFVLLCRRFPFENPWLSNYSSPVYPQCTPESSSRANFRNANQRIPSGGTLRTGTHRTHRGYPNEGLSPKAKDFLLLCLSRLPEQRPSLKKLRQHSFLALKPPSFWEVSNSLVLPSSHCTVLVT